MSLTQVSRVVVADKSASLATALELAAPMIAELLDEVQALVDTGQCERTGGPEVTAIEPPCEHLHVYSVHVPIARRRTLRGRAAARKAAEEASE